MSAAENLEPPASSLTELVRGHVHFIGRTLRLHGVPESEVDDGIQRVVLVLAEKRDQILPGRERSFLFQVARRVADHQRRSIQRRREDPLPEEEAPFAATSAEELVDQRRAVEMMREIMERMTDDLKNVFLLSDVEQMSKAEVADALRIPEGTVASRLRKAREVFRGEFERRTRGGFQ